MSAATTIRMDRIAATDWRDRRAAALARLAPHATERLARSTVHRKHPVRDFLFEYYSFRPNHLLRWSPGPDVVLEGARPADVAWPQFVPTESGVMLPSAAFPAKRAEFVGWTLAYLRAIAERPPALSCFGLHEWAMVYRAAEIRHDTPLRLSADAIAAVVEAGELRCTHFDAYRFFTPPAVPRNRIPLTRATTVENDQPGCVHVTMDLYKFAYKIAPWVDWNLLADAFELAWAARQLDMRASPYDLSEFGYPPVRIETRTGREEYVEGQRQLAERAAPVRARLIATYGLLADALTPSASARHTWPAPGR